MESGSLPEFVRKERENLILRATETGAPTLAAFAIQMWDSHSLAELERDFAGMLCNENAACFLAYAEGKPIGFAHCGLRFDYVEGTETTPVGYLEGILMVWMASISGCFRLIWQMY